MAEQRANDKKLRITQTRRLQRIGARREKLIDAYLAGALAVADLKRRQDALAAEQSDAERLLELASVNHKLVEERLEVALGLLEHCDRLYIGADDNSRRGLNLAFFAALHVDRGGVKRAVLNSPFRELTDRSIGLIADDGGDEDRGGPDGAPDDPEGGLEATEGLRRPQRPHRTRRVLVGSTAARGRQMKNPEASQPRGSNVTLMAERAGFEPAMRR
jgi:hypothetical protein